MLFVGAAGKSAQLPLHVWLPDAMEGPTPVSALIHAATMVTAGVYMVARNAMLFLHAPVVMEVVAVVGVADRAHGCHHRRRPDRHQARARVFDRLAARATCSWRPVSARSRAAIFHLMTHAFFKALLFLGSGSVIHAMAGEQDMQRMGGLRKFMPLTLPTMIVGTLAIAGIPPLSGFFSKDEILYRTFLGGSRPVDLASPASGLLPLPPRCLTAFYMFRLMSLTFFGTYRGAGAGRCMRRPRRQIEAAVHGVRIRSTRTLTVRRSVSSTRSATVGRRS